MLRIVDWQISTDISNDCTRSVFTLDPPVQGTEIPLSFVNSLQVDTAQYPRRFEFSVTPLWDTQTLQEVDNWGARWANQVVNILICEEY